MNLNTIEEVKRPTSAEHIGQWRDGYAWLAGGTWLFSEPQLATRTLIKLVAMITNTLLVKSNFRIGRIHHATGTALIIHRSMPF